MKCAVVGVGYLGNFHAQKYKNNPQVELVGVYDVNIQQAQKIAAELKVKAFSSLQEMIGQVQAVTIATNTKAHFEMAQFFLKNKIAVNVEKPMTATVTEAEELVLLAQQMKTPLSVGHIERFNPAVLELRQHLKNPVHFELKRTATFKLRGSDVSVLYDLMIHDLDLALWLTQSEPESWTVSGTKLISDEWDTCQANFKMKNGLFVSIEVSRVSAIAQRYIKVTQKESILNVNTGTLEFTEVKASPTGRESAEPQLIKTWVVDKKDALQEETNSFVKAVMSGQSMPVTAEDGLKAMKWIRRLEDDLAKLK